MSNFYETLNKVTENKKSWLTIQILALIAILISFVNLFLQVRSNALDEDEIEHAHVAWLLFKHKVLYIDFFEHHPPHYWYLLSSYYHIFGENAQVFLWGRTFMLLMFAVTIFFTYLIGKEIFGKVGSLIVPVVLCLNKYFQAAAIPMRPDGVMVALLFIGVYIFIWAWNRKFLWYHALFSGLFLGLAFSLHPRSGFTILGLAIAVLLGWSSKIGIKEIWERKISLIVFTLTALTLILLPFFIYGFSFYLENMYKISSRIALPFFEPWERLQDIFVRSFALFPLFFISLPVCVFLMFKDRRQFWLSGAIFWFSLFNLLGLFTGVLFMSKPEAYKNLSFIPPIHNFYVLIPSLALSTTQAMVWLVSQLSEPRRPWLLILFFSLAIISTLRPEYWYFTNGLNTNIAYIEKLNRVIPRDETFVGPTASSPVFRVDGTFHWVNVNLGLVKEILPNFHYDFPTEFKQKRPYVVNQEFLKRLDRDPQQAEQLKQYLQENYQPLKGFPSLLVRKDSTQQPSQQPSQ